LQDYLKVSTQRGEARSPAAARLPEAGRELPRSRAGHLSSEEIAQILGTANQETCRIFLAHRRGLSYREIARELQVPERTVQFHIARAMLILMKHRGSQN
jgi:DNA-directed RNA polymerase specialized sigma24 family protein